jgi:dihydroorotate dehydrogenase (fumarate)
MSDISVKYMGLDLRSPILAASSGLTTQLDKIIEFEKAGVGAIVVKSLFEEQISNEALFLDSQSHDYPESADYLHHYLRSNSLERYLSLIREIKSKVTVPVIASINCFSSGEWVSFASEVQSAGADALELNIYSMPLDIYKSSLDIENSYLKVVKDVSRSISIPVAVKIASTFTNLPAFVNSLKANGAKAVVMFNRFYSPNIDTNRLALYPADAFSHPEEYIKELRWMAIVSSLVKGIDLSASTGNYDGISVIKQILAGATTVQMCSALYKKGGVVISDAIMELENFMTKNGFESLVDFKGRLNYSSIENPDKFERVQFMKSFGSK